MSIIVVCIRRLAKLNFCPCLLTCIYNYITISLHQTSICVLASTDPDISRLSISHVRQAIRIASLVNRPIYSFHAGFRIDPKVRELGRQLDRHNLVARGLSLDLFGDRITTLAEEASHEGVTLLIENNVINKNNYESYGVTHCY